MTKTWLITGGCGFIGVNLVNGLKEHGHRIRVMDNFTAGSRDDLAAVTRFTEYRASHETSTDSVTLVTGDVRNLGDCRSAANGVDVVVHLAAQTGVIPSLEDPHFDCEQNVIGVLNMLTASWEAGVGKFIFASSAAPLGDQAPPVNEEKIPRPLSPYGASKLAGEGYCSAFYGSFGLDTICLRFSNVYGPYSFKKGSVVATFFRRALAGKALTVYGDGLQTRDFIHTSDLCGAIVRAAEKGPGGEIFQIATGCETSVNRLAEQVRSLVEGDTGRPVQLQYEPPRSGEIARNYADIAKAGRVLGYAPAISLDDGLRETWEWFRNHWPAPQASIS